MLQQLQLQSLPRVDVLDRETFIEHYLKPGKPVIMRSFAAHWPAMQKWTYEYLKTGCGAVEVPLYEEAFAGSGNDYMAAAKKMKFADYLDLIQAEPTHLRMFLFDVFKHMPNLLADFDYPDLGITFLKRFPFFFFGGEGSYVDIHYDLDHSHVFLTQFAGTKQVILYGPHNSKHLYQHLFTVSCNIDFRNPDLERYPKLLDAIGYEGTLEHGDTLFIPSKWWHYVYYTTGGFSLSLRALPNGLHKRAAGLISIGKLKLLDANLSKILGAKRWYDMKEKIAQRRGKHL